MFFIPFRQGGSDTVFPQIPKPKHWALGSGPSSNCFYLIKIKRKKGRSCQKRCWNEFIKERWCEIHRWLVYHQPQLPSPPPSLRTFLVVAATAIAPFLMAEGNGTLIFFFSLFLLPITSWSCFSFLCPSYSSLWILVNYGCSKEGSGAMSCLVLYIQTTVRILENLLSKEVRHNRFTKEISKENGCEMFPAEGGNRQMRAQSPGAGARRPDFQIWLSCSCLH